MQDMRRLTRTFIAFLLAAPTLVTAEVVRVATWDLAMDPSQGEESTIVHYSAEMLRQVNADVILLQGITGPDFSALLTEKLQPMVYQVIVSSSFEGVGRGSRANEVAILARSGSDYGGAQLWSAGELNRTGRGFAYAGLEFGGKRLAFYSAHLPGNGIHSEEPGLDIQLNILSREVSAELLIKHAKALARRKTSPADGAVIGGNFNTDPNLPIFLSESTFNQLRAAGFTPAFDSVKDGDRATVASNTKFPNASFDHVFLRNCFVEAGPTTVPTTLSPHSLVIVDIETDTFDPTLAAVAPAAPEPTAQEPPVESTITPVPTEDSPTSLSNRLAAHAPIFFWSAAGGLLVIAAVVQITTTSRERRRRRRLPARLVEDSPRGAVISCPSCDTSLIVPAQLTAGNEEHDGAEISAFNGHQCANGNEMDWQHRALHAEHRANQAAEVVKQGLIPHVSAWMRDRFLNRLLNQRKELVETQNVSTHQVSELEERVSKINSLFQDRIDDYESRIAELENDISTKEQLNKELLRSKILATDAARRARVARPGTVDHE